MTLKSLIARLDQNFDTPGHTALAEATTKLAAQLRELLNTPPGGPHIHPWRETGALHDGIEYQSDANEAAVGSISEVALYQEHGTATVPPRPTFGPLAATEGHPIAQSIGQAIAEALTTAIGAR